MGLVVPARCGRNPGSLIRLPFLCQTWGMDSPNRAVEHNVGDMSQYYANCRDNVTFVLDILDAMRGETDLIGDQHAARFWGGIGDAIRAFAVANLLE